MENNTDAEFVRLVEGLDLDSVTRRHRRRGWAWLAGAVVNLFAVVGLLTVNVVASFVAVCLVGVCLERSLNVLRPLVSVAVSRLNDRIR
jgi:hypothetical protein